MASTQTELARRAREEIERLERAATRTLREEAPTTHRARLEQNRLVDAFLRASVERAKRLVRVSRPRARTDERTDGRKSSTTTRSVVVVVAGRRASMGRSAGIDGVRANLGQRRTGRTRA